MAYPMKLIQVILYLTLVSHLVHCRTIQRDLNTFAKISKRNDKVDEDIGKFNSIFIQLSVYINGGDDNKISQETIDFLNDSTLIDNATDLLEQVRKSIYDNFTATCRRYTDVMTHKHKLQDVIFTMNDSLSNLTVISTDITHVIIQLELAASKLQSITLQHHNEPCVEFTGAQYLDIYTARYNNSSVYESLDNSVKLWGNKTNNCLQCNWNDYTR